MAAIPEKYLDLLQKKSFAQLATLMPDGSPQVSPVWVDYDGQHILINSAKGRVKDKNMRRDPRVGLDLLDPENPYRHLSVRGRVVDITEQGADAHIDKLAQKYLGKDKYPFRSAGEIRVIYKIEPKGAHVMG
jgi:PPOX class probable F420-dependent enzyme